MPDTPAHPPAGSTETPALLSTGIPGLDLVLGGGLPANRVYLIEGMPGTGKTTLALQFLLEGVARSSSPSCATAGTRAGTSCRP